AEVPSIAENSFSGPWGLIMGCAQAPIHKRASVATIIYRFISFIVLLSSDGTDEAGGEGHGVI
ncbi:MAG: hypothetical protein IKH91_07650, partial [Prevotella sp.]|nr:hypothetical protein [Prevotella sp.]